MVFANLTDSELVILAAVIFGVLVIGFVITIVGKVRDRRPEITDKTIKCPECGSIYHKSLYDFYYIRCTERGCGTFFNKETGRILKVNSKGQVLPGSKQP